VVSPARFSGDDKPGGKIRVLPRPRKPCSAHRRAWGDLPCERWQSVTLTPPMDRHQPRRRDRGARFTAGLDLGHDRLDEQRRCCRAGLISEARRAPCRLRCAAKYKVTSKHAGTSCKRRSSADDRVCNLNLDRRRRRSKTRKPGYGQLHPDRIAFTNIRSVRAYHSAAPPGTSHWQALDVTKTCAPNSRTGVDDDRLVHPAFGRGQVHLCQSVRKRLSHEAVTLSVDRRPMSATAEQDRGSCHTGNIRAWRVANVMVDRSSVSGLILP